MRQEVKKELDKLRELKTEWELKCHTDDTSLDQEIVEIEKQRQVLKKEMDTVFDELHQSLRKRHDTMNEELDKLCQERICIISKIKEMKQQAEHSKKEFDNLDRMTTFEMIQTKTSSLEIVLKDLEKMISEFKYRSVTALHELKLIVDQQEVNELKKRIDQLGRVYSSSPRDEISQNLSNPNEWLYDHSQVYLSNDNNVVRLVKKAENNTYPLSFNNTRMEIGIFKWKVKIEKLERIGVGWIGVGVSTEEIVSSRQFGAFVYPYESHKSYLISCNGYTWSMDLNENQKANGFKFTTGHELELEMNCNTRQLTIRKLGTNESFTFNNVVLPVYPSVALCGRDGSVTF
ncbi:hypothetical protein C9374_004738 [Naegleria lovaniensis]|uniref:B30.2/SPRY domain-containing protein n=1 Tax=Naegleria lovaniensis TaxID=51637 RepID=A0AA88GKQ7_NAELO|nr:uncharacterized protein C9374_004738 [Naegleria lovaniensis]KAG2382771.1 hypothetical protein C9374_004738 [Naegleria lovaniensis]